MASITKRNGKYLVRVRLRGNVRTKTFRTSAEAKAWAAQTEAEITSRALGITPKNQTVGDIIRRYRAEVTPTKRGSRSEDIRLARFLRDPIAQICRRARNRPQIPIVKKTPLAPPAALLPQAP